jgi:hypothetical protein
MKEVVTDQFDVQADDGTTYTVIEYTMMIPDNSISDSGPPIKGARRLVLLDRKADVYRRKDGTFQVTDTKQILWKIG